MSESRLIVGLGNPGQEYEYTRHNLGFLVLQQLAGKLSFKFSSSSLTRGFVAEGTWDGEKLTLLLPLTFMNNSGVAVRQFLHNRKVETKNILVVCDDFHFDFRQMRIRAKGSDGGHNGLSSVIKHLGSQDFARLRLGIGSPKNKDDVVDYVLGEFTKVERNELDDFIEQASECCLLWLKEGISKAMECYNQKS